MASRRPVLKAAKPPKGGDIESMLKFVKEQQAKVSEAEVNAKKLESMAKDRKKKEKQAAQSKLFMNEMRKLFKKNDFASQIAQHSLYQLALYVPETSDLYKLDAEYQKSYKKDFQECGFFFDRLDNIKTRKEDESIREMMSIVENQLTTYIESLSLPESYDSVVELVNKTKFKAPKKQAMDLSIYHPDVRGQVEDIVAVFDGLESEQKELHRKWLIDNGFDPDSKYGGWDEYEHQRFILSAGNWSVEFKDKDIEELHRHERWILKQQFLARRLESLRIELKRRIEMIISENERLKAEKLANEQLKAEAEQRMQTLLEQKDELNSRLQVEREEKKRKEEEKQRLLEEEMREKERQQKMEREKLEAEWSTAKKRVAEEKAKQAALKAQREKRMEQLKKKQDLEMKQRKQEAQKAVQRRKEIEEKKKAEQKAAEAAERLAQEEKKKRLDALAQKVRDEFGLDDLEADPTKPTKLQELRLKMEKEERPMYVPTSFASSLVEADPRIRIENALRDAGLINSPYAQQVMKQIGSLKPVPSAAQSHIKLGN